MNPAESKWDRIYTRRLQAESGNPESEMYDRPPSYAVNLAAPWLPTAGDALDIACGLGQNAFFLARHGLTVHAWDISSIAVDALNQRAQLSGASVRATQLDITPAALKPASCDVVIKCHYLDRDLYPAIRAALRPGGLIIMQTFVQGKLADVGPHNPDFLLAPGELLQVFGDYQVLAHQDERRNPDTDHPLAGCALIIARKPD